MNVELHLADPDGARQKHERREDAEHEQEEPGVEE